MNLVLKLFEFSLGSLDPLLHLLDQRLGVLGHCEESDIVLVSIDILLELVVFCDQPVLLGPYGTASAGSLASSPCGCAEPGLHGLIVGSLDLVLLLERHETDGLPSLGECLAGLGLRQFLRRNVCLDFLNESLLGLQVSRIAVLG